jgi:cell division protein FtsQ
MSTLVHAARDLAGRLPSRSAARPRGRSRSLTAPLPRPRVPLRVAVIATLVLAAAGGGYLWLRDSSLVRVDHVVIIGANGREAAQIRQVLRDTARDMTTLHVREDRLRTAVAPYPVVKDLRVHVDFPHTLRIEVIERHPVAVVVGVNQRQPVAADGTVLPIGAGSADLPQIAGSGAVAGSRLADVKSRDAAALLGAAPSVLRPLIASAGSDLQGLRVQFRGGPVVLFGSATELSAKWAAAARVMADPQSAGAVYVDVHVPARPVAGRFAGSPGTDTPSPPAQDTSSGSTTTSTDPASTTSTDATSTNGSTTTDSSGGGTN